MLTFRGTEIHEEPFNLASIHFDVRRGFSEPPNVRGEDYVVPGAEGRVWAPKQIDHRIIELEGFVRGWGDTLEERQEEWRTATSDLMSLMQFDDDPGQLVIEAPYFGVSGSWSIDAVAINTMGGPVLHRMTFQAWSIQLMAHSPEWEPGGSGS